jgi:hypothetical protein
LEPILVTASAAASWVLVISALSHALSRNLKGALRDQAVVPAWLHAPVATLTLVLEASLGATALWSIWSSNSVILPVVLVLEALLFTGYAAYLVMLLPRGTSVPCGCSTTGIPASRLAVGRNLTFALLAVVGASNPQPIVGASSDGLAVGTAAGFTFAVLLWILPDALATFEAEEADE